MKISEPTIVKASILVHGDVVPAFEGELEISLNAGRWENETLKNTLFDIEKALCRQFEHRVSLVLHGRCQECTGRLVESECLNPGCVLSVVDEESGHYICTECDHSDELRVFEPRPGGSIKTRLIHCVEHGAVPAKKVPKSSKTIRGEDMLTGEDMIYDRRLSYTCVCCNPEQNTVRFGKKAGVAQGPITVWCSEHGAGTIVAGTKKEECKRDKIVLSPPNFDKAVKLQRSINKCECHQMCRGCIALETNLSRMGVSPWSVPVYVSAFDARCTLDYKSAECGYGGSLYPDCHKTQEDCLQRGCKENFGGAWQV